MKRFLANERTRAGLLIVAAALIGGTGCVTAMVVGNAEQEMQYNQQRQKREEKLQLENAAMRAGAERGDVEAMTWLGWYQVIGNRFGVPADASGVTLLEQAAARQYAPAQFLLGLLMVEGRNGVPRKPARGLELLKLAATKICTVDTWPDGRPYYYPAGTLGHLYHKGNAAIPVDDSEAELWMARNAAYCRDFRNSAFFPAAGLSEEQRRARLQAWWLLSGRKETPANTTASPETERELQRLRRLVRDSEAKYPAPPRPKP
jgi:hypothetical protein